LGNNDVNGIALSARIHSGDGSKMQHKVEFFDFGTGNTGVVPFNRVLHPGETRTIRGVLYSDWSVKGKPGALANSTIVEVTLGRDILDQITVP
jgi:hypothetical protein